MLSYIDNNLIAAPIADVMPTLPLITINNPTVVKPRPKVTAKLTKPSKVTTIETALPKLEHANEAYDCTGDEIVPNDYRPLQAWLKAHGLPAKGTKVELKQRAIDFLNGDMSLVKATTPKKARAPKKEKHTAFALDYRTAQRTVKWFRENMPSAMLPELSKNIGWANVEANLDALLRTEWARGLSVKQLKDLAITAGMAQDMFESFTEQW